MINNIDIDQFADNFRITLVRRADGPDEEIFNRIGNLRADFITSKQIPKLSMNLLGGEFTVDDIKFRTTKRASEDWLGESIYLSDFEDCFEVIEGRSPIYLNLKGIHNKSIPYTLDVSSNKDAKNFAMTCGKVITKNKVDWSARTNVKHAPSKLNYWHVILDIETHHTADGDISLTDAKSAWQKEVCQAVLDHLILVNSTSKMPQHENIAKNCYLRASA